MPPLQLYGVTAALLVLVGSFFPLITFNQKTHWFRSVSMELFAERFLSTATAHLSTFLVLSVPLFALVVGADVRAVAPAADA